MSSESPLKDAEYILCLTVYVNAGKAPSWQKKLTNIFESSVKGVRVQSQVKISGDSLICAFRSQEPLFLCKYKKQETPR
jgi:hypothetical protein